MHFGAVVYESGDATLEHLTNASGEWRRYVVDSAGAAPTVNALVEPDGTAHIVYARTGAGVSHAWGKSGTYDRETVPGVTAVYLESMALGSDGAIHVPARDEAAKAWQYVSNGTGDWISESSPKQLGDSGAPALAVDAGGGAHAFFYEEVPSTTGTTTFAVMHTDRVGGHWRSEVVAAREGIRAGPLQARVDTSGLLHVVSFLGVYTKELPDGIDQNCDGVDGIDADGDGFASPETGGADCSDEDPMTYPDAKDPPGDGIDQDCDGLGGP